MVDPHASNVSRKRLILASASERRYELLSQIGCVPDLVVPANIDEKEFPGETPKQLVSRLAILKAKNVFEHHREAVVIAADTVVALGRRVLVKPRDSLEAESVLAMLSGRRHRVYTSVCVRSDESIRQRGVVTHVKFKKLKKNEICNYINSGEWKGKAGSYGIQGRAAAFTISITGSYTNVVGLPLYETYSLLGSVGYLSDLEE